MKSDICRQASHRSWFNYHDPDQGVFSSFLYSFQEKGILLVKHSICSHLWASKATWYYSLFSDNDLLLDSCLLTLTTANVHWLQWTSEKAQELVVPCVLSCECRTLLFPDEEFREGNRVEELSGNASTSICETSLSDRESRISKESSEIVKPRIANG
jgi:hypothetical protein